MQSRAYTLLLACLLTLLQHVAAAQAIDTPANTGENAPAANKEDTAVNKAPAKKHGLFKFVVNAVTRLPGDTLKNAKGAEPFMQYKGKTIRHISINRFGFERQFTDTSKRIHYFGTNLLNRLHHTSKTWVIKDNLFIREGQTVNPYKVADNEKYLRTLKFIQDARIIIKPVAEDTDYVDIEVLTKDVFSLSANVQELGMSSFKGGAGDANVLGTAQDVSFNVALQSDRSPSFGYSVAYNKVNLAGSFINAGIGYSTINPDLQNVALDERAWYVTLQRPLMSQYAHFAGGLTIGRRQTYDTYLKPSYEFYNYGYNCFDAWLGYNLAINKYLQNSSIKDRRFISFRYFKNSFYIKPLQAVNKYNFRYDDREAALAQFTFFKQDFYTTNYIYGFGNREDVPNGYNIAFTTGWYKQADLNRAYAGVDANLYMASINGDFVQYFLRAGSFFNAGHMQDAALLFGTSVFSRLMAFKNTRVRQYLNISYTRLFNRVGLDPLDLNNVFGLRNFNADSVMGVQRLSLYAETFMFLKYKAFGFKFAPFLLWDASLITPEDRGLLKSDMYWGIGGGVRTRNENLVFNTIQLRFVYFPRNPQGNNSFKISLVTNLNFRYNSNYVNEPDIIQLNTSNNNGIY